jgi:hypothetical protein
LDDAVGDIEECLKQSGLPESVTGAFCPANELTCPVARFFFFADGVFDAANRVSNRGIRAFC